MRGRRSLRAAIAMLVAFVLGSGALVIEAQGNADVRNGIELVRAGDFEAAVAVLRPLTLALEGLPRQLRELAQAYLFLGIAELELGRRDAAQRAFHEAQRRDRALTLPTAEFSAEVRRVFEEARTYTPETPPPAAPAAAAPVAVTAVAPVVDPATWLRSDQNATHLDAVLGGPDGSCAGELQLERRARTLAWVPKANQQCGAWQAPFTEIRNVSAAPEGGFVVQFRSAARPRQVFMPASDAAVFDGGLIGLSAASMPASARVAVRVALRVLEEGLGTSSGRLSGPSTAGPPLQVSLAELMESPADYDGRAVRTSGRLDVISKERGQYLLYSQEFSVLVRPESDIAVRLRVDADKLKDTEIEVVGAFGRLADPREVRRRKPEFAISAWSYDTPDTATAPSNAKKLTLAELATAERLPGEPIRVIGKYRGFNVFGDLPTITRRSRGDWVIKDDVYAIWITGRSPSGDGFSVETLGDVQNEQAMHWMEVAGQVEERDGAIYLRAASVKLSPPPSAGASVRAQPRPDSARIAPDIQFTSPIEGLEEAGPDGRFLIQFTKAMDRATFAGRVQLRYAGDSTPLTSVRFLYFDTRRVLEVDPGVVLLPGKTIECLLLGGIKDVDGADLAVGAGAVDRAVRVLRWAVSLE